MAQIMVLDDVLDAGVLIKKILERKGHSVQVFDEEEEALNYAKGHPVELAILDIKLKKLTGIEVLEELKKTKRDIKVIMLTGYPTIETARQAVNLGAAEYCVKPIDKDELEEKVAQVLKS
jgi:DNA-binding NtrC family response regulator